MNQLHAGDKVAPGAEPLLLARAATWPTRGLTDLGWGGGWWAEGAAGNAPARGAVMDPVFA
jgi:hypothetical protein